jgi:hypothetical protein
LIFLAIEQVVPIAGKAERMKVHLKNCKSVSADNRTVALLSSASNPSFQQQTLANTHLPSSPVSPAYANAIERLPSMGAALSYLVKWSKSWHEVASDDIRTLVKTHSPAELQEEFSADICKLFITINAAWAAANNPGFHRFIHKWIGPQVVVQDWHIISGRVLDKEMQKVEEGVVCKVKGKLATGQCDGWKNIAKTSLVSLMMSVENEVCHTK